MILVCALNSANNFHEKIVKGVFSLIYWQLFFKEKDTILQSLLRIGGFGLFQVIVAALISIYIESVASGNLLFTDGILAKEFQKNIIDHPKMVISCLLGLNMLLFVFMEQKRLRLINHKIYNNICHRIFSNFIDSEPILENGDFKIIFFKVYRNLYVMRERNFIPAFGPYLKPSGYFETKQGGKTYSHKFLPRQGWAGICYRTASIVQKEISKYDDKNPQNYYKQCKEHFNIPKWKINKHEDKPCSFLCFPIKYYDSHKVSGVIALECTEKNKIKHLDVRKLEEIISHYSAFFHLND